MAANWMQAKIMFEMGKSLNQISNELGIDKGNISKKAKKDNWQKGKLQPIIQDAVRVQEAFTILSQPELEAVVNERDDILRFRNKRDKIVDLAFDRIASELPTCEVQHIKPLIEAADKTCIMAEIAPRFNPNSGAKINNTVAQQNHVADGEAIEQHFNWTILPVESHHIDTHARDYKQDDD
jgi:hypothetical protein